MHKCSSSITPNRKHNVPVPQIKNEASNNVLNITGNLSECLGAYLLQLIFKDNHEMFKIFGHLFVYSHASSDCKLVIAYALSILRPMHTEVKSQIVMRNF